VQPLPPDLTELLREYLHDKPVGQPVWPGKWAKDHCGAEMMRMDLEAAEIPYVVDGPDGPLFAGFHALRHSYLTLGGRAGIDLRTLQELAGHSTPTLTARYSHRRLYDLAGAVEKLPRFLPDERPDEPQVLRATGTEGAGVLAFCLAPQGRPEGTSVGAGGLSGAMAVESQRFGNSAVSAENVEKLSPGSVCTSGGGPGLQNQSLPATTYDNNVTSATEHERLAFCLALLTQKSPDLALVVERWDTLPRAVRTGIMAMVRSTAGDD
jgi:hypothetical protein